MFLITKTISLFDRVKGTLFGKTTSEGVVSKAVLNPPHIERAEINIQKPEPLGVSPAPLKTNAFSKFLISKNWIRVTSFGTGVMTAASIGFLSYLMGTGVVAGMTAAVSSMLLSIFIFYAAMTAFFKKTTDQAIFHALPDFAKTAQITDKPAINKLHPSKEVPATIGTGFTSNQGASPGALQQQLYNRIFQKMTPIDQHIGGIRFSFRISMFGEGQQQTAAGRVQYLSPKTLENFSGHSAAEIEGRLRKIDWSQKWVEQLLNHSKTVTENEAYENLAHAVHRMTQVLQNKTFLNNDSANYFVDTSRGMELGLQFMHFKSQEIFKVVEKQFSNSKSGDLTPAKTNQELMALVLASRSRQVDYIEEALQNSWHVYDSDGALEKDIRFKLSSYLSKNYTPALNKRVEKISIEDNDYQLKKEELIRAVEKAILESFSALAIDEVGGIKDKKTFLSDFAAAAVHEMLFGYATVQAAEKSFIYLNQKEEDANTLAALAAYFIPVLYPEVLTKERDFAQRRQKIEEVLREIKKDNQKINQKVNRTMSAQLNTRDFNKKEFAATLEYSLARIFAERVGDADFISEAGLGDMYARGFLKENLKNVNALIEPQVELNINVSPEFETWITSQSGRFALKEIVNAKPGSKEKTLVINGKVDARDVLALLENNPALNIKQKKSLYGQLSKQKTTVSDVAIPRKDKEKLGELKKIFRAERHRIKFSAKEKKLYFYGEISEAEKNRLQELLPEQYYSLEAAYSLSKDKGVGALLSNGGMRKAVYNQLYFADLSDDPTDLKTYRATAEKVKSEKALFLAENANQITLMSEIIHLEIVKLYEKYYAGLSKALSTSTGIKLWEKEEVYWRGLTEEWLKHMEANPFLQKYFSEAQTENFKNGLSQIVQKVLNPQHEMMVFGATGTLHHLHQFKGFAELDLTETVANIFSKKIPLPVFPQVYFEDEKENARFESTLENFIQAVQGNSTVGNKYFDLDVLARDLPQIIEDGIVLADNPGTIAFKKGSQFMNRYMLNERSRIALFSEAELAKGGAPSGRVKALVALRDFFNKSTLNSDQKKQLIEHAQHFIIYQKELSLIKMELLSRIRSEHVPEEIENVLLEKIYKHIVKGLKSHRSALSASVINEILSSETFMESIKPQELLTEIYFKNSDFEGGITKNKGAKAGVLFKNMLKEIDSSNTTSYMKNLPDYSQAPITWHRTPMHLRGRTKAFNVNFALMGADELPVKIKDELFLLFDEYRRLKAEGDTQITLTRLFLSLDEQVTSGYKTVSREFYNENGIRFEMASLIKRLTEKFDSDFSNDLQKSNQEIISKLTHSLEAKTNQEKMLLRWIEQAKLALVNEFNFKFMSVNDKDNFNLRFNTENTYQIWSPDEFGNATRHQTIMVDQEAQGFSAAGSNENVSLLDQKVGMDSHQFYTGRAEGAHGNRALEGCGYLVNVQAYKMSKVNRYHLVLNQKRASKNADYLMTVLLPTVYEKLTGISKKDFVDPNNKAFVSKKVQNLPFILKGLNIIPWAYKKWTVQEKNMMGDSGGAARFQKWVSVTNLAAVPFGIFAVQTVLGSVLWTPAVVVSGVILGSAFVFVAKRAVVALTRIAVDLLGLSAAVRKTLFYQTLRYDWMNLDNNGNRLEQREIISVAPSAVEDKAGQDIMTTTYRYHHLLKGEVHSSEIRRLKKLKKNLAPYLEVTGDIDMLRLRPAYLLPLINCLNNENRLSLNLINHLDKTFEKDKQFYSLITSNAAFRKELEQILVPRTLKLRQKSVGIGFSKFMVGAAEDPQVLLTQRFRWFGAQAELVGQTSKYFVEAFKRSIKAQIENAELRGQDVSKASVWSPKYLWSGIRAESISTRLGNIVSLMYPFMGGAANIATSVLGAYIIFSFPVLGLAPMMALGAFAISGFMHYLFVFAHINAAMSRLGYPKKDLYAMMALEELYSYRLISAAWGALFNRTAMPFIQTPANLDFPRKTLFYFKKNATHSEVKKFEAVCAEDKIRSIRGFFKRLKVNYQVLRSLHRDVWSNAPFKTIFTPKLLSKDNKNTNINPTRSMWAAAYLRLVANFAMAGICVIGAATGFSLFIFFPVGTAITAPILFLGVLPWPLIKISWILRGLRKVIATPSVESVDIMNQNKKVK